MSKMGSATNIAPRTSAPTTTTTNAPIKTRPVTETRMGAALCNALTLAAVLAAVLLLPWNSADKWTGYLHELLYAPSAPTGGAEGGAVGPLLLAAIVRPLLMLLDARLVDAALQQLRSLAALAPHRHALALIGTATLDTHAAALLLCRLALAGGVCAAWAFVRTRLVTRVGARSAGVWFTLLLAAGLVPAVAATRLDAPALSALAIAFALGWLLDGHHARALSLLTANAVLNDALHGSLILLATLLLLPALAPRARTTSALGAVLVTLPPALLVAIAFDSLCAGRFLWAQGEALLRLHAALPHWHVPRAIAPDTVRALAPLVLLGPLALAAPQPLARATLLLAFIPTWVVALLRAGLPPAMALLPGAAPPTWPALAISAAASLAALAGHTRARRLCTGLCAIALCAALAFLSISMTLPCLRLGQHGGHALFALSRFLAENGNAPGPVRVFVHPDAPLHGASPFLHASPATALYAHPGNINAAFRPDYLVIPADACAPGATPLRVFPGLARVDVRNWHVVPAPGALALFRAASCPAFLASLTAPPAPSSQPPASPRTGALIARILGPRFASSRDQGALLARTIGRFGFHKAASSLLLFAYLYANILLQF